jgi:tRNA1Val (adenine37-N6)-methyltransferase
LTSQNPVQPGQFIFSAALSLALIVQFTIFLMSCQPLIRDESNQQTALCREVGSSIDGRLLAAFVNPAPGERLAELGSGCGEVSLQIAQSTPNVTIDGLEIQPALVEIAQSRSARCQLSDRVQMINGDIRSAPKTMRSGSYDHIFSNPPFFKLGEGRLPPDRERALARFEQAGSLEDFIECGAGLLKKNGIFSMIHKPERLPEIITKFHGAGLAPFRIIPIQDRPETAAIRLLIAAKKAEPTPMLLEPAWIITTFPD